MPDQQIRDRKGRLIARVKTLSSGKLKIWDAKGRMLGTYDPRSNETRDASGRLVARGNALTSLLKPF